MMREVSSLGGPEFPTEEEKFDEEKNVLHVVCHRCFNRADADNGMGR